MPLAEQDGGLTFDPAVAGKYCFWSPSVHAVICFLFKSK